MEETGTSTNSIIDGITAADEIRRELPPLEDIPGSWDWLWWLLLVVVVAAVVYQLVKRWLNRKREEPTIVVPAVPAHIRALAKLKEAFTLIDRPEPFCVAVSNAVRNFLEEQMGLRAPERTTEEFLNEMATHNELRYAHQELLRGFLTHCDLVKFARHQPKREELVELYEAAIQFVEEMRPEEEVAVETETQGGAEARG